jgi:coenzyme F420-reducing hydrogenase alpha subunit
MHEDHTDAELDNATNIASHGGPEFKIHIDNITKVEGHGSLEIKVTGNKVKYVKLEITESKRFFTQAIRNKPALSLPLMTSRICGTCSIAQLSCCTEAVENAIGCEITDQTKLLRKLSVYGMMIRDHAMHLFLFCLPDILGRDSILDFDDAQTEMLKRAFIVKAAGNNLSKLVAGRAIHATFSQVGSFSHVPQKDDVKKVIEELKSARGLVMEFIEVFYNSPFKMERDIDFVALVTKDYSFLDGVTVEGTKGFCVPKGRYWDYIDRVIIPYSTATGYKFEGKEYMVGALARMNLNRQNLHKDTQKEIPKYLSAFPSKNIYSNNLAQAIEILHSIDHSIELLESNDFREEKALQVVMKEGEGVGLIEAPRGTLYYMLSIDKSGKVQYGNIIVPTQQNQISMEKSVLSFVEEQLGNGADKKRIEFEIEKLIRAYDPCMSCASHFLKINWSSGK